MAYSGKWHDLWSSSYLFDVYHWGSNKICWAFKACCSTARTFRVLFEIWSNSWWFWVGGNSTAIRAHSQSHSKVAHTTMQKAIWRMDWILSTWISNCLSKVSRCNVFGKVYRGTKGIEQQQQQTRHTDSITNKTRKKIEKSFLTNAARASPGEK